jgi:hypothetical protein
VKRIGWQKISLEAAAEQNVMEISSESIND